MERGQSTEIKVWVNGTFDILHRGHIEMIQFASTLGVLRVGVDFDDRVRSIKGLSRPFNIWEDRVYFLNQIKGVDSVVGFGSEDELKEQIKNWGTNILVVGEEYKDKNVIGGELVDEVIFFKKVKNFSTTNILKDK